METRDDKSQRTLGEHFRVAEDGRTLDAARMLEALDAKMFDAGSTVRVGRFEVRDRLGAGGMGVVMSAFDPQLERLVAVKVLRDDGEPKEQARLLQEARAMAKVRHPNLVTVYEAGTHDEAVYIAMEFADHGTLRNWLGQQSRSWQEIVSVFAGAADGLQALHEAGLIHRDFKPDNVLLGEDDRPRVSDFGLVRPRVSDAPAPDLDVSENADPVATHTRGVAGTPNYLAPEQWGGERADAASDQWSFFVALHEALFGQRPFTSDTVGGLCLAVMSGKRTPLPEAAPSVPAWLSKAIDRGLSAEPSARFPSMEAVAQVLRRGVEARRSRTLPTVLGAMLVTAAVVGVAVSSENPCDQPDTRLDSVWTPERRASLAQEFAAAATIGGDTWTAVERRIDDHLQGWVTQRADACEATHVRGEQSEDALDLRMRCLERRALEVESLLASFEGIEARGVYGALQATERLGELSVCADLEFLRLSRPTPESSELRAAVADLRVRASRLDVAMQAGKSTGNVDTIRGLLEEARALDYEPLEAEILQLSGGAFTRLGQGTEAAAAYEQAFEHALATHHLEVQVWAAVSLSYVYGSILHDVGAARRWGGQGRALLRAHDAFPEAQRSVEVNLGAAAVQAGEFDVARAHLETAAKLYAEAGLQDSVRAISIDANLGSLARRNEQFDLAVERLESARAKARRVLDVRHPMNGSLNNSLAISYFYGGKLDKAEALYRESLALLDVELEPTSPRLGHPLNNLAEVLVRQGQAEEALPYADRAVAIWTNDETAATTLLHEALRTRAEVLVELGRHEDALADLTRARTLHAKPFGSAEPRYKWLLARCHAPTNPAKARALIDEALALDVRDDALRATLEAWPR